MDREGQSDGGRLPRFATSDGIDTDFRSVYRDIFVTSAEWCRCFEKADRPCVAMKRRSKPGLLGAYKPSCDVEGFFQPTQCHTAVGTCWCVDKHGVEQNGSRSRGKPDCGTFHFRAPLAVDAHLSDFDLGLIILFGYCFVMNTHRRNPEQKWPYEGRADERERRG